jgi:hypothetical protein
LDCHKLCHALPIESTGTYYSTTEEAKDNEEKLSKLRYTEVSRDALDIHAK